MTREDFSNLSPLEQENFINSGGQFSEVSSFSSDKKEQVADKSGFSSSPDKEVSSFPPSQPAPEFDSIDKTNDMGFDIQDPVELLFLLDHEVREGIVKLHPWQIQFMLDFANSDRKQSFPFQGIVRACNGSGKDKIIVAACSVWLLMRYRWARCIITSASGQQLDNQTEVYIKMLCEAANTRFGAEIWKCNKRYYECIHTNSPMKLFATDEPGKAEGYHPLTSNGKFAIFTSEGKTISDEIFMALERCTGYTHRVDVSTPGLPMGYFHDTCRQAIARNSIENILSIAPEDFIEYHIQAKDCTHITQNILNKLKRTIPGGEKSPAYQSIVFAEFGNTDEMVVIPYTYISQSFLRNDIQYYPESYNTGGLDLSDGGDETVLVVRNGNKHLATIPFKFDNTEDTITFLKEKFKEWKLDHKEALVFGDYGGLGAPMLKALKRSGWSNIRFIDSRTKAYQPKVYLNRGTELFFNVRKLFEKKEIILKKDDLLIRQLSTRYYKINANNIHQLLSKLESRSKGYPSPDRADAFNLCFWNYKSTKIETQEEIDEQRPWGKEEEVTVTGDLNVKSWAEGSQKKWVANNGQKDFSALEGAVERYNKQILTSKNN